MSSSSVSNFLPFHKIFSNEVNLHILSFLEKKDFPAIASTCKEFEILSKDCQIWKQTIESEFGKCVSNESEHSNKAWKQTYKELDAGRKAREIAAKLSSDAKKTSSIDFKWCQVRVEVLS
jgi:F-box domain